MISVVICIVDICHTVVIRHFIRIVEAIAIIIIIDVVIDSITIKIFRISIPLIMNAIVVIIWIDIVRHAISVVVIGSTVALVI